MAPHSCREIPWYRECAGNQTVSATSDATWPAHSRYNAYDLPPMIVTLSLLAPEIASRNLKRYAAISEAMAPEPARSTLGRSDLPERVHP